MSALPLRGTSGSGRRPPPPTGEPEAAKRHNARGMVALHEHLTGSADLDDRLRDEADRLFEHAPAGSCSYGAAVELARRLEGG